MKRRVFVALTGGIVLLLISVFRVYTGYWPLPQIVRKIYYINKAEKTPLKKVVVDRNFRYDTQGYVSTSEVSSQYPLGHNLVLIVLDSPSRVPVDYKLKSQFEVELFRGGKVIYHEFTKAPRNIMRYGPDGQPTATYAFLISKLPFPVGSRSYRDVSIRVCTQNPDVALPAHATNVQLCLVPDLVL